MWNLHLYYSLTVRRLLFWKICNMRCHDLFCYKCLALLKSFEFIDTKGSLIIRSDSYIINVAEPALLRMMQPRLVMPGEAL